MQGLPYDLDSFFPEGPDYLQEEEICLKDYEDLKRLYPKWARYISGVIEEYTDRFEYEGSILYHEYPDEVSVYRMAEEIFDIAGYEAGDDDAGIITDIIRLMLCNEIYIRRRRHEHTRIFRERT
jgi:hypothetical protein